MSTGRLPGHGSGSPAVAPPGGGRASPEPLAAAEVTRYVVTAAVWAPSVHNTQPWRFTASGEELGLYADAGRQLRVADPDGREMMISCGAALFTARLALRSLGEAGRPDRVRAAAFRPGAAAADAPRRF